MAFVGYGLGGAIGTLGTPVTSSVEYLYSALVSETLGVAGVVTPGTTALASDTFRAQELVDAARAFPVVASDNLGLSGTFGVTVAVLVREGLGLEAALVPVTIRALEIADGLGFSGALTVAHPAVIAEGLGLAEQWSVGEAVLVAEQLGLAAVLGSVGTFGVELRETLGISAELARFLGADVTEGIGIEAVGSVVARLAGSITEGLGVEAAVSPRLLIHVTVEESLGLDPEAVLGAIFSPEIVEGVGFSIGHLAPDGSFTTWVMNARSGAVTEYDNYVFNSFARIGNKYVGASSSGLYELLGDDDEGTAIIPVLKSGFMQFGSTQLSRLKAAYVATRSAGDFVLRIETGDGATYDYACSTRDMRSTKVHMGKGQRARYFAFELIGAGEDFDLDTLEFVPIVLQRRV